jgi:low molecular weight phosphotyrosine protein phosphatase
MAEAFLRFLVQTHPALSNKISRIDSAGTCDYHSGSSPDPRTLSTLRSHGVKSYKHVSRQITASDFAEFDYILAMDHSNLRDLQRMQKSALGRNTTLKQGKLGQVRLFGEGRGGDELVGDPYYGGEQGFEECFAQVERFARGFVGELCERWDGEANEEGK